MEVTVTHSFANISSIRITYMEEKNIIDCLSKSCTFTELKVLFITRTEDGQTMEKFVCQKYAHFKRFSLIWPNHSAIALYLKVQTNFHPAGKGQSLRTHGRGHGYAM